MIRFFSYRLNDAQTERKYLAMLRYLGECRWQVMGSEFPIIVYSAHEALRSSIKGRTGPAGSRHGGTLTTPSVCLCVKVTGHGPISDALVGCHDSRLKMEIPK